MSIKILNEGFELLHKNSLCEEKSNSSDLEKALESALNRLAMKQEINIKKYEIAFQDVIESQFPEKSWWEVTDCNIFWDLMENRDPSLTIQHIIDNLKPEFKESFGEDLKKEQKRISNSKMTENKQKQLRKSIKESLRRKRLGESEKESIIKRYSDVRPYSERKYWYFTTHGVQPGSIPRDLNVLEVRDGQNDKGTWGTFVMLDGILNTSELRKYDMRELAPKEETEKRRMRPQGERITAWESYKKKNPVRESYDEKIVIYKDGQGYKATPESNYRARIQNARKIQNLKDFDSADEIIDYYVKYGWAKGREDFEVIDECKLDERNLTRAERHNRNMDRIFNNKKEQDKKFANFLKKNGYSDESIEKLRKQDKLSAEIASKFTPKGKQPSYVLGKILGESRKQKHRLKESYDYFETEDAVYSTHNGKHYVHKNEWDKISPAGKYWKQEISLREYTKAYRISEYDKGHSLKESKKLTESFDDMQVFMNTWANYNEYGADGVLTPTGWMSIDDAIDYCEEYADYEPFINDTDNIPFDDINEYSNASSVLQELKELQESNVDEEVVAAIVEATGYSVKEAVEIAESGDYFWYPGLSSYTDLAYAVIDEIGSLKDALGDRVVNYIDEDQMRREYRWDIREIMRDSAEDAVDEAHEGEDEDSYDREQEIEDWMDEHEDEYLDMIIDEDIRMAEAGEIDLSNYFDYEAFGRDLSFDGYTIVDGGIILVN